MSEDENDNEKSIDEEREKFIDDEREKLKEMGVSSTWDILTTGEKKKKKPEDKKNFIGFN